VHLVGFIINKFVTMRGHMNVKLSTVFLSSFARWRLDVSSKRWYPYASLYSVTTPKTTNRNFVAL